MPSIVMQPVRVNPPDSWHRLQQLDGVSLPAQPLQQGKLPGLD
jgi:hypothetical protein